MQVEFGGPSGGALSRARLETPWSSLANAALTPPERDRRGSAGFPLAPLAFNVGESASRPGAFASAARFGARAVGRTASDARSRLGATNGLGRDSRAFARSARSFRASRRRKTARRAAARSTTSAVVRASARSSQISALRPRRVSVAPTRLSIVGVRGRGRARRFVDPGDDARLFAAPSPRRIEAFAPVVVGTELASAPSAPSQDASRARFFGSPRRNGERFASHSGRYDETATLAAIPRDVSARSEDAFVVVAPGAFSGSPDVMTPPFSARRATIAFRANETPRAFASPRRAESFARGRRASFFPASRFAESSGEESEATRSPLEAFHAVVRGAAVVPSLRGTTGASETRRSSSPGSRREVAFASPRRFQASFPGNAARSTFGAPGVGERSFAISPSFAGSPSFLPSSLAGASLADASFAGASLAGASLARSKGAGGMSSRLVESPFGSEGSAATRTPGEYASSLFFSGRGAASFATRRGRRPAGVPSPLGFSALAGRLWSERLLFPGLDSLTDRARSRAEKGGVSFSSRRASGARRDRVAAGPSWSSSGDSGMPGSTDLSRVEKLLKESRDALVTLASVAESDMTLNVEN